MEKIKDANYFNIKPMFCWSLWNSFSAPEGPTKHPVQAAVPACSQLGKDSDSPHQGFGKSRAQISFAPWKQAFRGENEERAKASLREAVTVPGETSPREQRVRFLSQASERECRLLKTRLQ